MVDAGIVGWLKEGALYSTATDAGAAATWGEDAIETKITSPLALTAGAAAEAARQLAFLGGAPLVEEVHDLPGLLAGFIGRPVTITGDRLGYDAGLVVFVIDAQEQERVERTTLTVLRRLP